MLTGAALGSRLGFAAQALYLAAGAAGASVFAPSVTLPPGALRLIGPTGGYLMAYPIAAFATGWLAERGWDRRYLTSLASMLAGLAVIFLGGVSWKAFGLHEPLAVALATGFVPFVLADVLSRGCGPHPPQVGTWFAAISGRSPGFIHRSSRDRRTLERGRLARDDPWFSTVRAVPIERRRTTS